MSTFNFVGNRRRVGKILLKTGASMWFLYALLLIGMGAYSVFDESLWYVYLLFDLLGIAVLMIGGLFVMAFGSMLLGQSVQPRPQ